MSHDCTGLLLRLAGPLSAFGTTAAFHHRDTAAHPTRSALIGMFAAAAGRTQTEVLSPHHDLDGAPTYVQLSFTVRIDRPGTLHTDFHTVGGGHPRSHQPRTSSGEHRPQRQSTLISHRRYLADAVFTVAVSGPPLLIHAVQDHLEHPHWAPYLGRRACVPTEPLVLGQHHNPVTELLHHTPLSLPTPPPPTASTVPVDFIWDKPPTHTTAHSHYELTDDPEDYTSARRRYRTRTLWRTTEHLPATLYAGRRPLQRLTAYIHPEAPCPPQP